MVSEIDETITIDTSADYEYLYEGLSRQSIDFHQSIAELVDNAISAKARLMTYRTLGAPRKPLSYRP